MAHQNLNNPEETHIDEVDAKGGRKEGVNLILGISMVMILLAMILIFILFVL